jgi:hypothetical protein
MLAYMILAKLVAHVALMKGHPIKSILLRVPDKLKQRLDAVRAEGYTLNGYIVHMLKRELKSRSHRRRGTRRSKARKGIR